MKSVKDKTLQPQKESVESTDAAKPPSADTQVPTQQGTAFNDGKEEDIVIKPAKTIDENTDITLLDENGVVTMVGNMSEDLLSFFKQNIDAFKETDSSDSGLQGQPNQISDELLAFIKKMVEQHIELDIDFNEEDDDGKPKMQAFVIHERENAGPDDEFWEDEAFEYEEIDLSGVRLVHSIIDEETEAHTTVCLDANVRDGIGAKAALSGLLPSQYVARLLSAEPLDDKTQTFVNEHLADFNCDSVRNDDIEAKNENETVATFTIAKDILKQAYAKAILKGVPFSDYVRNTLEAAYLGDETEREMREKVDRLGLDYFYLVIIPFPEGDTYVSLEMPLELREAIAEKLVANLDTYDADNSLPPFAFYARSLMSTHLPELEAAVLATQLPASFEIEGFTIPQNTWPKDGHALVNFTMPSTMAKAFYITAARQGKTVHEFMLDVFKNDVGLS